MKKLVIVTILIALVPVVNGFAFLGKKIASDEPLGAADVVVLVISTVLGLACVAVGHWVAQGHLKKKDE